MLSDGARGLPHVIDTTHNSMQETIVHNLVSVGSCMGMCMVAFGTVHLFLCFMEKSSSDIIWHNNVGLQQLLLFLIAYLNSYPTINYVPTFIYTLDPPH